MESIFERLKNPKPTVCVIGPNDTASEAFHIVASQGNDFFFKKVFPLLNEIRMRGEDHFNIHNSETAKTQTPCVVFDKMEFKQAEFARIRKIEGITEHTLPLKLFIDFKVCNTQDHYRAQFEFLCFSHNDYTFCPILYLLGVNQQSLTYVQVSFVKLSIIPRNVPVLLLPNNPICDFCCKVTPKENLKRCSGCKYAYYCSEACQKADWSFHKARCKIIQDCKQNK